MKFSLIPISLILALGLTACNPRPEETAEKHGPDATNIEHEDEHRDEDIARGPRGGRLFEKNGFALEATIFEQGVAPQFRIYPTLQKKPLDPAQVQLQVTLQRLGATQTLSFKAENDYLVSTASVNEPHSFVVTLNARLLSHPQAPQQEPPQSFEFSYEQVEGRVILNAAQRKAAGLEILKAGPAAVRDDVELQGEVRVAPNSETVVLTPVAGVVTSAPVNLGQQVSAGTVLATLESRELADLKRAFLEARERARLAEGNFQRESMLWKEKITAEQDYLQTKSQKAEADINLASNRAALLSFGLSNAELNTLSLERPGNLARFSLRAPRSGRVTARTLSPGQRVTPDSALFTIADLDNLVAVLSATPAQLNGLKPGQEAQVSLVNGNASGKGRVQVLSPQLNESSRAAAVYVALEHNGLWQPGQFVKARVTRAKTNAAVTVSNEALQTYRDWTVVYAKFGDQFEVRPVSLGRQDGERTEILSGLSAGQDYVGKNSFLLKADLGKAEAEHDD